MGILDKFFNRPVEQKSYSAPQLLVGQYGSAPRFNNWDTDLAIKEGYKNSTWVFSCVKLRASSVAQVPWKAERKTSDGWQHEPNSDLQKLLDRPNPDMDRALFFKYVVQHLDL